MKFVLSLFGMILVYILTVVATQISSAQGTDSDPIGFIAHGAFFDRNGNELRINEEFIRKAQDFYIRRLTRAASEGQLTSHNQRAAGMSGVAASGQAQLLANSVLIQKLIEEVKPADASALSGKNFLMRRYLQSRLPQFNQPTALKSGVPFTPPAKLKELLQAPAGQIAAVDPGDTSGEEYIKRCAAEGVPTPPDWGDAAWINRGLQTVALISADKPVVEVYSYQSAAPEGVCLALPRSESATTENPKPDIQLVGVICLGKVSGKACFWDNQENKLQFPIARGERVSLLRFAGGAALDGGSGGTCTSCHAGENPYILHPKTALGLPNLKGLPLRGDNYYQPLVAAGWPKNSNPSTLLDGVASDGSCLECHTQKGSGGRFPEIVVGLRDGYCQLLPKVFKQTMPPFAPGDAEYKPHVDALLAACNALPAPTP